MITFVMSGDHHYTITTVLETRSHARHGGIIILTFQEFLRMPKLPVSDYVFVDLERQGRDVLAAAQARLKLLRDAMPGMRVLNPPSPCLGRLEVMRRLYQPEINRFRVLAATNLPHDLSFPVFLRRLDDHEGPMTALLPSAAAMEEAIAALLKRGIPRDALAVTEYVNARNKDGWHEKRSYFRIGDRLFPSALDASSNWICKGNVDDTNKVDTHAREMEFLAGNEDHDIMLHAFDAAGITYGRADYAVVEGRPQLFEINTNPMIERPEAMPKGERDYSETVLTRWLDALAEFSPARPGEEARWIAVGGASIAAPTMTGHRVRRAVRKVLAVTGRLHRETAVMRRLRTIGIMR